MNFWCWLLGHKWYVFTPGLQSKRKCKRCGKKQKWKFEFPSSPFLYANPPGQIGEWVDVN